MSIYINGGNFASLDDGGKVPASQLPSYVDDVVEYANLAALPATGESGKIYVAIDTRRVYRWSGSVYVEVSPSDVTSVAGRTGSVTLTKSDVGLGSVDNTSDAAKPVSTATQAALDGKQASGSYAAASHTHTASAITDFTTAVQAAAPATTNASLLTSGTLADARLTANVVLTGDARLSDARTPTDGSVTDAKVTSGGLSASSINWAAIAEWQPSTSYAKGALVSYLGVGYRRSFAGTTGATFNLANWQQITPSVNVVGSPSQITSNQNDYALPAATDIIRISSDAARTITGIVAGVSGQAHLMINVGSFAITLSHASTSSASGNRFAVPWAGNYVLDANGGAALIVYDSTSAVWRVV